MLFLHHNGFDPMVQATSDSIDLLLSSQLIKPMLWNTLDRIPNHTTHKTYIYKTHSRIQHVRICITRFIKSSFETLVLSIYWIGCGLVVSRLKIVFLLERNKNLRCKWILLTHLLIQCVLCVFFFGFILMLKNICDKSYLFAEQQKLHTERKKCGQNDIEHEKCIKCLFFSAKKKLRFNSPFKTM